MAAFERAIDNAFDGGKPLITEDEAQAVGQALMQRIARAPARRRPAPRCRTWPRTRSAYLVGADVGRSLAPIKDELDLPVRDAGHPHQRSPRARRC